MVVMVRVSVVQRDFTLSMVCAFVWLETYWNKNTLKCESCSTDCSQDLRSDQWIFVHVKRGNSENTTTGLCQPCPAECSVECGTFTGACESCSSGYYLSNGVCIKCSDNCVTCTNSDQCTSCIHGKYLNNSTCIPCPVECGGDCNGSDGSCLSCPEGLQLVNGLCICLVGTYWNKDTLKCESWFVKVSPDLRSDQWDIVHVKKGGNSETQRLVFVNHAQLGCSVECGTFTGACESCSSGYYLSNGVCINCFGQLCHLHQQ